MDSMIISNEWANRPDDQRFLSVQELHAFNLHKKEIATEAPVALEHLRLGTREDGSELLVSSPSTETARLNNWSFGQLCQRAGAPAGYLRSLPAALAVLPLQWSIERAQNAGDDAKLLLHKNGGQNCDAVTSATYGRIFDASMTEGIIKHVDLGAWKVPAASYAAHDPKRATTLYASDRDCFVCLVNVENPITVPGEKEPLYRGFIARNSEVGAAAFDFLAFLYRRICDNRIIWGGREIQSLKIRHTSGGPQRFIAQAAPALNAYMNASTEGVVAQIGAAQAKQVGTSEAEVQAWIRARGFTVPQAKRAVELAAQEPGLNPRSVWGVVQGLTSAAHEIKHGDERFDLERKASKLMDLAG
jgi:hypothetical protein